MVDIEEPNMFCYQCEQTLDGKGCMIEKGVCGKTPEVAALQDLLIEVLKKIARYVSLARDMGVTIKGIDYFVLETMFSTMTNVNFDDTRMDNYLREAGAKLSEIKKAYFEACKGKNVAPKGVKYGDWEYKPNIHTLIEEGKLHIHLDNDEDLDVLSTKNLSLFALKGAAAYLHHSLVLGIEDEKVYSQFQEMLGTLTNKMKFEEAVGTALRVGELCYKVMEILDTANTKKYGNPEITTVRMTPIKGKCILVSGHDLRDVELVLQQTKGKDINVYTHGELLPANSYPKLKEHKHLVGHYGGPWQKQQTEFKNFPGAVLMTTNCIIEPRKEYKGRIFTRACVGWPGVKHIADDNLAPLIEAALKEPGFKEDKPKKEFTIGFARTTVLSLADVIIKAVKAGAIKHFFLIGGCDGNELDRSYYSDFAKEVPKDCIILTLGCGKYRVISLDLGEITFEGTKIPRLLDMGQCNDAYSAIQVALALSKAFGVGVNELPLSLVISWFEQKAVCVLLALLHLGVKNIVLGPRLPAFVTPKLLGLLVEKYAIRPISEDVKSDLTFLLTRNSK